MNTDQMSERLSRITTNWEELMAAHQGKSSFSQIDKAEKAQSEVLRRYVNCVYYYILGATKDHHAAEDLTQEFAFRFVRGDYRNAKPERGRFRDYLKTSVRNMVTDHFRTQGSQKIASEQRVSKIDIPTFDSLEKSFVEQWRQRTLGIAWESLKQYEASKNNFYFTVLQTRAQNQSATSDELAELFSNQLDKPVTAEWVRQKLHRARRKFAELLIEEVGNTLQSQVKSEIQEELVALGLRDYVEV